MPAPASLVLRPRECGQSPGPAIASGPQEGRGQSMKAVAAVRAMACFCAAIAVAPTQASADAVADFYRGKSISMLIGFPPGGGYDLYGRVVAPFFTRHIPGNPQIIAKSMLGGSGILAAGHMTKITPQD